MLLEAWQASQAMQTQSNIATLMPIKRSAEEIEARQEVKNLARESLRQAKRESRVQDRYFKAVKAAALARKSKFDFARSSDMDTFAALALYANEQVEVVNNDRFAIIWDAANDVTKQWIWNNTQNLIFNPQRIRKIQDWLRQPIVINQNATNPYIVSFVNTAHLPTRVLASNSRAVVI